MGKVLEFFHSVKKETAKVHFPTRKEMIKYSRATIAFILIFSIFFLMSDVIIALLKMLVN